MEEDLGSDFGGFWARSNDKWDGWGHSYLIVRDKILGFMKDEQLRKYLPRMFSLIKNKS